VYLAAYQFRAIITKGRGKNYKNKENTGIVLGPYGMVGIQASRIGNSSTRSEAMSRVREGMASTLLSEGQQAVYQPPP
jgi:hypothetical protein